MSRALVYLEHSPARDFPGVLILFSLIRWLVLPRDRTRSKWLLAASLLTIPVPVMSQVIATALSPLRPLKYDLYAYRIDSFFGQPRCEEKYGL
jgi:hypothetical protein